MDAGRQGKGVVEVEDEDEVGRDAMGVIDTQVDQWMIST